MVRLEEHRQLENACRVSRLVPVTTSLSICSRFFAVTFTRPPVGRAGPAVRAEARGAKLDALVTVGPPMNA
jgi:hypothetical protein